MGKKVAGIEVEKVGERYVAEALVRHGLDAAGPLDQRISRLVSFYRESTPRNRLADCMTCHGISDVALEVCPFCGDGEVDENSSPTTPLVEESQTERDLDRAVARVQALKKNSASSIWELGQEILRVYDSSLWKQRRSNAGAPKWRSWGQFCDGELGVTPAYAYKLMDVAKAFSKSEVEEVGVKKLHLTLQVPREHRHKLLEAAKDGASAREVNDLANSVGKTRRDTGRTGSGGAGTHKGDARGGRKPEKITVAALVGRVEIPLMRGTSDKRARNMADVPRGTERLLNGVTQVFVVTRDEEGRWLLIVERVRE